MIIKKIKYLIEAIYNYDYVRRRYIEAVNRDIPILENKIESLNKELEKLKSKPDVNDADYWNDRWKKSIVYYSAPKRKKVTEYLIYKPIREISEIATMIKSMSSDLDDVPLNIMKWVEKSFKKGKFTYKPDKGEIWTPPEEILKEDYKSYLDCDDVAILEYYIIREVFMQLKVWDKVKHKLKCVCGNVNKYNRLPSPEGSHFYLIWLHSDGNWYTIESTYYRRKAIDNYGQLPQKYNPAYGVIWFTFSEEYSFAQNSLVVSKKDLNIRR
jgi:hypothetical protein